MQRRQFIPLASSTLLAAPSPQFIKSICNSVFPPSTPLDQQFALARNAGFEGIEIRLADQLHTATPRDQARRIAASARKHKISIVSLWTSSSIEQAWLNHHDPAIREQGIAILHKAIDLAQLMSCGALLIVPGRLGNGPQFVYGYQESWDRITASLKQLTTHAAAAKVYLTPENVWNKFLLSPIEMKTFLDQFQSPWLQAHFDIGNVMQFGYPQDWIQTLGPRIKRLHVKDYKLSTRSEQGRFVDLLQGDVDFKEVMAALRKINYRGFISPEYGPRPDDPSHLLNLSKALDRILSL